MNKGTKNALIYNLKNYYDMKKLIIMILTVSVAISLRGQEVEVAFYYSNTNDMYGSSAESYSPLLNASPAVRAKSESGNEVYRGSINAWQFRKFTIVEELIRRSTEEELQVHSFRIVRCTKRFDPKAKEQLGFRLDGEIAQMIREARSGDTYYIYEVRVKCPEGEVYNYPYTAVAQVK